MSKERNSVIGIELRELRDLIQQAVRDEIEKSINDNRFGTGFADEVWDRKTVANFLRISPEKVTYLVKRSELPGKIFGREYMFLKSQIIKMFNEKKK